ncbi:MAG: hypothetical protein V1772_12170 [Chloroflexota bacterium]
MEKELGLYISAAPDVDSECEALGRLLAEMTKGVRWTIKRTPSPPQRLNPDLHHLRRSHFYLILLGQDVVAPMGVELDAARAAQLLLMPFRSRAATPSPAAAHFYHHSNLHWQWYDTPHEFVRQFERRLLAELIAGTPGYGLDLADIEELSVRLKALEGGEPPSAEDDPRQGAGRGGVIFPAS